jgi:phosphatidylglycerophosphate synthase
MQRVQFDAADRVTAFRAGLAGVVAVLTVHGLFGDPHVTLLVVLSTVALVLDAVDGYVARRTGHVTAFGARFDMEVDAFLIAVLSVHVAPHLGWWVLAIGAMRYAYVAAGRLLPWLTRPVPPRHWAKVVAAIQGIVLTVAASRLLPDPVAQVALGAALVLLVESFGNDVWWQWRHRHAPADADPARLAARPAAPAGVVTVAAAVVLWFALAPPRVADGLAPGDFARIPVEGLALVGLALALPTRARRVAAVGLGIVAAVLAVLRALGLGFDLYLDRPFHVLGDWSYLPKGFEVVRDTEGGATAVLLLAGAVVLTLGLLALLPWAALRVTRAAAEHRRGSVRTILALGSVWVLAAVFGGPAGQVAAAGSAGLVVDTVGQVRDDYADRDTFRDELEADRYADTPPAQLLAGLRGKDVLVVWVESYGRVALEDSSLAPGVVDVLEQGDRDLTTAGYQTRSAFLTSPTFGAGSWLAHATLQSGLWVDSEQRYGQLLDSDRMSLTDAFGRAGWRTTFTVPANTRDWPEGAAYYGFDQLYDSRNVDYKGPEFGYASMPDQYTLDHFRRTELAGTDRRPVMAEIDLISSHHPWAPLPESVPWNEVGDGSVFAGMPERGEAAVDGDQDPATAQRLYGESIEYTWRTLVSWLVHYPDPDRVLIVAGDHQPHSFVSGDNPGHDVPVTVIALDPNVMQRIADWDWQPGLHPTPDAPVWPMDSIRDRLFESFGSDAG